MYLRSPRRIGEPARNCRKPASAVLLFIRRVPSASVDAVDVACRGTVVRHTGRRDPGITEVHPPLIHIHTVRIRVLSLFQTDDIEDSTVPDVLFHEQIVVRVTDPNARRIPGQTVWSR